MYNIQENYNIPFQQAQQMNEYSFKSATQYSLSELNGIISRNNGNEINDAVFILEFGNIDIELNILPLDNNYYDIGYFVCIKSANGWQSDDYTDKEFNITDLDNIEEIMYNELMKYASSHNLYWSKEN